jgi:hypothetical protein
MVGGTTPNLYLVASNVGALSRMACRVSFTISISMASPASTSWSSVIPDAPRRDVPSRATNGTWMKAASDGPSGRRLASIARQLK